MIQDSDHILTSSEKKERRLDDDKMYVLRFLFNNKMNKATDPAPFGVHTDLLDKLREDAIGMPWIVPEFGEGMHIRGKYDKPEDEVSSLLDLQKKYTVGEIVDTVRYSSDNVWGVIEVFPKFQASVERGYFPPLVSPTLNIIQKSDDGQVLDAQFINLQSVPKSGYPAHLTQVQGICKADMIDCMPELKIQGSAGGDSFSNTNSQVSKSMSAEEATTSEAPSNEEVVQAVEAVAAKLKTVEEVIVEVAVEAEGVDETKIAEALPDVESSGEASESTEEPAAVEGAAGPNAVVQSLEQKIATLEKNAATSNKLIKQYERESIARKQALATQHAESIVERKLRGKTYTEDERVKLISEWSKKPLDVLELVDNELKSTIPESTEGSTIEGAYGTYGTDLSVRNSTNHKKNSEMGVIL